MPDIELLSAYKLDEGNSEWFTLGQGKVHGLDTLASHHLCF